MATFSVLRAAPLVALSHNSLFPSLIIGPDAVTIRVVRRHVLTYADLAEIRLSRRIGHRLIFSPKRGWRDFTVNFAGRDMAQLAVRTLARHGAPLNSDALTLLD